MSRTVFVTGATGFMGRALIPKLLARGHAVRGLVRAGSEKRLPAGCSPVIGDATDAASYESALSGVDTVVQLAGVSHPNPARAASFKTVDGAAGEGAVAAAARSGVRHFVYVSVAQPAPVMRTYIAVRAAVEEAIRRAGLPATILRPWYVLGPGRRWPMFMLPFYWLFEAIPFTRAAARRLGFVTIDQMAGALLTAVENPPASGARVWDVPLIRTGGRNE